MSCRGKKVPVPRIRVPSTNTTPTRRGTSTPTSASSTNKSNQSCTFTPIKIVDASHTSSVPERTEPKLLKPLGPTVRGFKSKAFTQEEQITFLYMAAQQQHFLNCALEDAQDRILKQSDDQLEKLSAMVKAKENELAETESTIHLIEQHSILTMIESKLETTLKDVKDVVLQVTEIAQVMAQGLEPVRNRIELINLNVPALEEMDEVNRLIEDAAKTATNISTDHLTEAVEVANKIVKIQCQMKEEIQIIEEEQSIMSETIQRLGQELALSDEPPSSWKTLDDLEI